MSKRLSILPLAALALAVPALAQAQNYSDLPPLTPPTLTAMSPAEQRALPSDMRTAPMTARTDETVTVVNGVETITRTRRIDAPRPSAAVPAQTYAPSYTQGYAPMPTTAYYSGTPAVFEREQWVDECQRRTRGRGKDDTGLIIGGLLGAIAGGFAGYEIAGVGDRVLGTVLGVGSGGLIGGLLGSLFDGDKKKNLYNCEAALDSYLSTYGAPGQRIASREIPYPAYADQGAYGYGYPAGYGYGYSPPPQVVLVPVRTEVQQQVVVRETERYETYSVPGAERIIPGPVPRPSPKMIKDR